MPVNGLLADSNLVIDGIVLILLDLQTSVLWQSSRIHCWQRHIPILEMCTKKEANFKKLWKTTDTLFVWSQTSSMGTLTWLPLWLLLATWSRLFKHMSQPFSTILYVEFHWHKLAILWISYFLFFWLVSFFLTGFVLCTQWLRQLT